MVRNQQASAFGSVASLGWIIPMGIIAFFAMTEGAPQDAAPVSAQAVPYPDADRDGFRDEYEAVIRTSTEATDSDRDGWSDAEEFALKTSPSSQMSLPGDLPRVEMNMLARGTSGTVHVLIAAYYRYSDDVANTKLSMGVLSKRRYYKLTSNYIAANAEMKVISAQPAGARIVFYEIAFPESLVLGSGHVTFLSMLTDVNAQDDPFIVSAIDLYATSDDVIVLDYPISMLPHDDGSTGGHAGTVYLPIPTTGGGGTPVPPSWTNAKLCLKSSETVGSVGALITKEIVEADCIDGFEGFCPPSCAANVGNTVTTVDPLTLAGGQ